MSGSAPRVRRRATLATCGVTHALHDGFSDVLYVLLPLWSQEFGLSLTQVGLLKTLYSGALSGFQIPAGLLAERFGERTLLAAGTAVVGVGYLLFGLAGGFAGLAGLLVAAGIASGTQHPLSSSLVAKAFAPAVRRTALGTYNFTGDLGKVVFPALVAVIAAAYGWRHGTTAFGALGIAAGLGIYIAFRIIGAGGAPAAAQPPGEAASQGWASTTAAASPCCRPSS